MRLNNIYDFKFYQRKKDEDIIHQRIANIVENAHLLGSVIQLKTHFKEWLVLKEATVKREQEFSEELERVKVING